MGQPQSHGIIAAACHVLDAVRALEVDKNKTNVELIKAKRLIDAELQNAAIKAAGPPMCQCGHGKALHPAGGPCRRRDDCCCVYGWTPA